jgi:uncharacterized 2Fe-2S/4Fe-4S cluster protein (DUF4445 family)
VSWISFHPFAKKAQSDGIRTILELARELGLPLNAGCGGKKICGKCLVRVESPHPPLPPPSQREIEIIGARLEEGYRLACDTVPSGEAAVYLPEESLMNRQVILTSDTAHPYPVRIRPLLSTHFLEVPHPVLHAVSGDRERLLSALKETYGLDKVTLDLFVLRKLPTLLGEGQKGLTATLRAKREIIDLKPGRSDALFGIAFDIGTTTVVGYLLDLRTGRKVSVKSALNPQIAFGDDVITRISFCQSRVNGLQELQDNLLNCLNTLIREAAQEAGINPEKILEAVVVGNTVMHHLFGGLDPRRLSLAPYTPVLQEPQDFKARDLGLIIGPAAYLHLLPLKAGFVGSDTIAGILATGQNRVRAWTLLVDLGTNGEIVIGNRDHLIACSTAAGPAFEGGHIRHGMRAAAGAIERVKIHPSSYEVICKTIQGRPPVGICGSGVISAVAGMLRAGMILEKGTLNPKIGSPRLREGPDGLEFVLAWAKDSGIPQDIALSGEDIAQLQVAKAAVQAGITLLQECTGLNPLKEIWLAGACGNYTDPEDARTIGLFPGDKKIRVHGVGNAAGHGACLSLLNKNKRKEAQGIARRLEYLELAGNARFQELFVSAMFFPAARDFKDGF